MRPPLAPLGFSACRGLVASYAGAFLAPAGLLLAADYFAEAIATTTTATTGESGGGNGERLLQRLNTVAPQLEGASFRTFTALAQAQAAAANRREGNEDEDGRNDYDEEDDGDDDQEEDAENEADGDADSGLVVKTADPMDFWVNHFSDWARWHRAWLASPSPSTSSHSSSPSSEDSKSAWAVHKRREALLSTALEQSECGSASSKSVTPLPRALAAIPFWSRSAKASGGNAHYDPAIDDNDDGNVNNDGNKEDEDNKDVKDRGRRRRPPPPPPRSLSASRRLKLQQAAAAVCWTAHCQGAPFVKRVERSTLSWLKLM